MATIWEWFNIPYKNQQIYGLKQVKIIHTLVLFNLDLIKHFLFLHVKRYVITFAFLYLCGINKILVYLRLFIESVYYTVYFVYTFLKGKINWKIVWFCSYNVFFNSHFSLTAIICLLWYLNCNTIDKNGTYKTREISISV